MAAPTLISELSQTIGSNGPDGATVSPIELDNYQRAHAGFIAQLRDGKGFATITSIASAATADIGAINSFFIQVTGTTTISSFGTTYNGPRFLKFSGAVTLTHSATLSLPGGADITTGANDSLIAVPNFAGTGWNVFAYQRAAGAPTFSAYLAASGGSISDSTFTKCLFDAELWDTESNFAASRFTATVAGYYQINASCQVSPTAPGFITIYVNGSEYKRGAWATVADASQDFSVSGLVKLAVSDYVEIYLYQSDGGAVTPQGGATVSWFDGHFVRGV